MEKTKPLRSLFLNIIICVCSIYVFTIQADDENFNVAYTQASSSNLRTNWGADSEIIRKLPINSKVHILEKDKDWVFVRISDQLDIKGWLHQSLVAIRPLSLEEARVRYEGLPKTSLTRLKWIERAAALAPYDQSILNELFQTLQLHDKPEQAKRVSSYLAELKARHQNETAGSNQINNSSCNPLGGPVKPIFTSAYSKDGELRFSPIFKIDWESLTPDWITSIDTKNPTKYHIHLIKENMYYEASSELHYYAPLDCTTSIGRHFLISDDGIKPVTPLKLKGTKRFGIFENDISDRGSFGEIVVSLAPQDVPTVGFIMLWNETYEKGPKINPEVELNVSENNGQVTYTYGTYNGEIKMTKKWNREIDHPLEIDRMYEFNIDGTDYIYVRWKGNAGICLHYATLFESWTHRTTPYLREVDITGSSCGWL